MSHSCNMPGLSLPGFIVYLLFPPLCLFSVNYEIKAKKIFKKTSAVLQTWWHFTLLIWFQLEKLRWKSMKSVNMLTYNSTNSGLMTVVLNLEVLWALQMSCLQRSSISLISWSHVKLSLAFYVVIRGQRDSQPCPIFSVISGLSLKAVRPQALKTSDWILSRQTQNFTLLCFY